MWRVTQDVPRKTLKGYNCSQPLIILSVLLSLKLKFSVFLYFVTTQTVEQWHLKYATNGTKYAHVSRCDVICPCPYESLRSKPRRIWVYVWPQLKKSDLLIMYFTKLCYWYPLWLANLRKTDSVTTKSKREANKIMRDICSTSYGIYCTRLTGGIPLFVTHTTPAKKHEFSRCQLWHHWRQRRLSLWQPPLPLGMSKLASW